MKSNDSILENFLTFLLSGFAISIFFTKTGISIFGLASICLILVWKYFIKYEQTNFIPRPVFWLTLLFFLDLVVSAAMSDNSKWAFSELGKYRHIFFGGLVFIAPLSNENRKKIIVVFFISAALDALTGLLQYFNFIRMAYDRPHGFSSHPILYAADLAFACSTALVLLLIPNNIYKSMQEKYFLGAVMFLTGLSIVLSQSRGVWVAFLVASTAVLLMYERKKALIFFLSIFVIFAGVFSISAKLRQRAESIVTSVYTEDEQGSTGMRLELWKGCFILFKENPLLGTGYGDFREYVKRLVEEKRLRDITAAVHAHNIFLQVVVTRGIIGLGVLVGLFWSLLRWGRGLIKNVGGIGGYIIILSAVLTIIGGLTEDNIEIHRFLAFFSMVIGLFGPLRQGFPLDADA